MTSILRARKVIEATGLSVDAPLERADSVFNEVWFYGPYVLRISGSTATRRLAYEYQIAQVLPKEVRYPEIYSYGRDEFAEWMVMRRHVGQHLATDWQTMSDGLRHQAVYQLAEIMQAIHTTPAPVDEAGTPLTPPFLEGDTLECPHQLPALRLLKLIDRARKLRGVDLRVLDAANSFVLEHADALDGPIPLGLIHGDLHFSNVLWDGTAISATLDFEWSRLAAPDIDLDILLRVCADPEMHLGNTDKSIATREAYHNVPRWLREAYPEPFEHPRLAERLELYSLSFDVRDLLLHPPRGLELPPNHPLNRIKKTVEGRSYVNWLEF